MKLSKLLRYLMVVLPVAVQMIDALERDPPK